MARRTPPARYRLSTGRDIDAAVSERMARYQALAARQGNPIPPAAARFMAGRLARAGRRSTGNT